ncbi:hypothetical protein Nepgr_006561 [Nepenthes gracilis]|uniref:Uncharacterized protein n=1 Tax=Nepenthes gracilis TaxID=150966 RepID=A0AAD3S5G5_NEPGR|nr:hypothetical protein Nepgr_006561 [Nepenthes gracilis]
MERQLQLRLHPTEALYKWITPNCLHGERTSFEPNKQKIEHLKKFPKRVHIAAGYTHHQQQKVTIPQHQTQRPISFIGSCHPTLEEIGANHIREFKPQKAQLMSSRGNKSSLETTNCQSKFSN